MVHYELVEMDIQEANREAFHVTPHKCDGMKAFPLKLRVKLENIS